MDGTVTKKKRAADLVDTDFHLSPVWMIAGSDKEGEPLVRPVRRLPVTSGGAKLFGTQVRLANGERYWSMIGNVWMRKPEVMEQCARLSLFHERWFHLEPYFGVDYERHGPDGLADFLGLPVDSVFPIHYDLRALAVGSEECLVGAFRREPRRRMSETERRTLILNELEEDLRANGDEEHSGD
jgi:hypothetical protein